jgi:hypothetical protein
MMNTKKVIRQKDFPASGSPIGVLLSVFSFSALTIVGVQTIRGANISESYDKLLFLGAIFAGGIAALSSSQVKGRPLPVFAPLVLLVISLLGIFSVEKHTQINGVDINKILWFGFGPYVGVLTLLLVPFVFQIYTTRGKTFKGVSSAFAIALIVLLIPAAWQGGASLMEPDSPEYVINELLSVPSGHIPYVDFIPQYGILYSWLITPFSSYLSVDGLVTLGLYLMSLGGIVAVLIGVWLTYKALGSKSIPLATMLIVPLTSIAQFPGRSSFSGSIFSTPTQIPVRILPGMIVGLLLLTSIFATKISTKKISSIAGYLFMGLTLWLNTDFGLALLLAVLLFMALQNNSVIPYIMNGVWLTVGFLSYPFLLLVFGKSFKWNDFGTFVRQFGGGFGAESIHTPGPVLFILPIIISVFFVSTLSLLKQKFEKIVFSQDEYRALATASFFSTWSLIGFAYYLNRSYASGQMQILFLPLSISMASLFHFLSLRNGGTIPWTGKTFFQSQNWGKTNFKKTISHLSLAVVMALPIATVIAFPSPAVEIERLTNAPRDHQWPLLKNEAAFKDLENILTMPGIKTDVGYFGSSSNYVQLKYGVNSVMLFNSPFDLFMSQNMVDKGCGFLFSANPLYVITNDTGASVAQNFQNKLLCGKYVSSIDYPIRLFKRQ